MKIKIGNKIFDSNEEPVLLIFENDDDRIQHGKKILNMAETSNEVVRKYCAFPKKKDVNEILDFMKI